MTRSGERSPEQGAAAGAVAEGAADAGAVAEPGVEAGAVAEPDADAGAPAEPAADAGSTAERGPAAERPAPAGRSPRAEVVRAGAGRSPRRQRVAVIIPAKDEARRIAATVRAARAIPGVDLVLVVDDGSEDTTQHVARDAGAVVVRHSHNRGKAAAMETGAAVVAMRDAPDRPARLLLFIDGDLAETAVNTAPLVAPVVAGEADLTVALLPPQPGAGGRGIVVGAARRGIAQLTGWTPAQPLSGMRCLTRAAYEAATPLARGWGVEVGMTIDLLRGGFRVLEVPCELRHRPSAKSWAGQAHRAAQYRDVQLAINTRRARATAGAVRDTVATRSFGRRKAR